MNILVIPSIRENCLKEFLQAWQSQGDWDKIILIEDNPEKTFKIESKWEIHHFSHKEIKERLTDKSWIISKKDSACRSFGFKIANEMGAKWVISLDDDCYPDNSYKGICQKHLDIICGFKVCKQSAGTRTRGLPYKNLGLLDNVVCNMGLWTNNGDWDSVQSLSDANLLDYFIPPEGSFLAHPRHRYPFCGMNIFFRADLIPIMYFPLMGEGQVYNRFDDIWAGWIFQKILSHLNMSWSIGEPWVEHKRASNPFVNLIKEATGINKNETFWQIINEINLTEFTLVGCMKEIGHNLITNSDDYMKQLGWAILIWCSI